MRLKHVRIGPVRITLYGVVKAQFFLWGYMVAFIFTLAFFEGFAPFAIASIAFSQLSRV